MKRNRLLCMTCLLVLLLMIGTTCSTHMVIVGPSLEVDCTTPIIDNPTSVNLTTALRELRNNSVLYLEEGCHDLTSYELISSLINITIQADANSSAIITCAYGVGLGFFNITNLTMIGFTVDNCSLIGSKGLGQSIVTVNETLSLVYGVADNTKVSIFLADIRNLTLRDVTVENNKGIGLLGINIMEQSYLESLMFANNTPNECEIALYQYIDVPDSIAGGMFLLYADYRTEGHTNNITPSLYIDQSTYQYNKQCSVSASLPTASVVSPSISRVGFIVGGGAGLGIGLSQLQYSVHITVSNTNFIGNDGLQASAYIAQFQGSSGSQILFHDCLFKGNGFNNFGGSSFTDQLRSTGGAVSLILDVPFRLRSSTAGIVQDDLIGNQYMFQNVDFIDNRGYQAAGIYVQGLNAALTTIYNENEVHINNSTFTGNKASIAPALYAFEYKFSGLQPGIQLYMNNVTVQDNDGTVDLIPGLEPTVIVIASMNLTLSGQCTFKNNFGSALTILTGSLHTTGNILFENNTASSGGAILIFSDSYIIVHNNTNLQFTHNTATSIGGAVYLRPTGTTIGAQCILWFEDIDILCGYYTFNCVNPADLNVQISFDNNNAQLGKAVYGNLLANCSWLIALQQSNSSFNTTSSSLEILEIISNNTSNNFKFILPYKNDDREVNTNAVQFELLSNEGNSTDNPIRLFPGQVANINITAIDGLFQSVPLSITSRTAETNMRSQLGQSGFWFLAGDRQTLTPVTLYGNRDSNSTVSIYSVTSTATANIHLELQNCSYGFIFQDMSCVCDPNLLDQTNLDTFQCNASSGSITVPRFFWLGPASSAGEYSLQECIFNYCNQGSITFSGVGDLDTQCADNRADILCGKCAEEYSTVIGSTRCIQCNNNPGRIIGIILAFLIAGVVLVCVIAFLNVTVAEGYINGVIFYANLLAFYVPTFSQILSPGTTSPFLFISWINFDPGFELCIFKGMDTLTQTALSFLFPGYLFLLMSIIIWLAKRSKHITKHGVSAIKAFATLLLLCYSSVATTCVKLLSYVTIVGSNGHYVGWRFDPNVEYGQGTHGFLVFISVCLLVVYIIPFALILASPPKLMNKTKCGRKIALQYKPVFDAFHNPLKENFSFWVGFRCIIRTIPLVIAGVSTYPTNVFATTVFITCFLFMHETLQPFKKTLQNKMETYFLINLLLFGVGTLYYPQSETYFDETVSTAYIIILVIFAYSGLVVVGCIHVHIHYPSLLSTIKNKLTHFCYYKCCGCCCKKKSIDLEVTTNEEQDDSIKLALDESFVQKVVTYTELREPLLDSGHVVLTKVEDKHV